MQVYSQAQSLEETGPQDGVGQRVAPHPVESRFEKTASPSGASTSIGEVTDRGLVKLSPTTQKFRP
jgi:hypothetical protein